MWGEGKKLHPALSGRRDNSAQTPFLCRSLGSPICGMGERERWVPRKGSYSLALKVPSSLSAQKSSEALQNILMLV